MALMMATMNDAPAPASRSERTRQALLEAGLGLLVDRPIDAIPIDDIVASAGVAKGSFFNHFRDKQQFGGAVASFVRQGLEAQVDAANAGRSDPVERLAGGMRIAAVFACLEPGRTIVMLRGLPGMMAPDNPLNRGVAADLAAAVAAGQVRPEAAAAGVLYWLGVCQALVVNIIDARPNGTEATAVLRDMIVLGLCGLGVAADRAVQVAEDIARPPLRGGA